MRLRLTALLFAILLSTSLSAAYGPGTAYIQDRSTNSALGLNASFIWVYPHGASYASPIGTALIYQLTPLGAGHFLIGAPNVVIFERWRTVSVWDDKQRFFGDPETGIREIFTSDADLGEIAPARFGNFIVAEQSNTPEVGAKLIEFNVSGVVAEFRLPTILDVPRNRVLGANHVELLADGCTVLYTLGHDDPNPGRVHRFDMCTGAAEADFWVPTASTDYAGSVRQLPNGNVLVACGNAVRELTPEGVPAHEWAFPGVTHLALTTDGQAFYAGGVDHEKTDFRLYQLDTPSDVPKSIPLGNPEMRSALSPVEVLELVVVGEWRAGWVFARPRAVRH